MGALEPCASSTNRTICANAVSLPTFVARKMKLPVLFSVAPMTRSPEVFSTGTGSPVSMAEGIADAHFAESLPTRIQHLSNPCISRSRTRAVGEVRRHVSRERFEVRSAKLRYRAAVHDCNERATASAPRVIRKRSNGVHSNTLRGHHDAEQEGDGWSVHPLELEFPGFRPSAESASNEF